jgi:serine/threonine-protein kinase
VQTSALDPLVGRTLEGRYRLLERIARGGMSTVYAAVDERLDRNVAVKVMSAALSADPAFTDRFAREARAAARLTHVNTVSVYDQGQEYAADGHHVFLVMELVEGRTLRELLRERHRLSPAEALSVMEPVLSALSAAHRAGLVHRDVKPENILISDDGVVKVADFGLAHAIEADASSTRTGLMMGTVAYCAPEQIARGYADPRSDVYSAGIVMFELLTGQVPYRGDTAMNVAYQHVHNRVPAPSSRVRGIPSEIDELVVMATDSDADARPDDAGAFLAEIADARAALNLPIIPLPVRPRRPRRPATTDAGARGNATEVLGNRARPAAGRNTTATIPHNGTVGGRALIRPPEEVLPPPVVIPPAKRTTKQRRRRRALIVLVVLLLLGGAAGYGSWYYFKGRFSKVPSVIGSSSAAAERAVKGAGFKVREITKIDDRDPSKDGVPKKGEIFSTSPGAGDRLARGKTVTIYISSGPQIFTVPSVVKDTPEDATIALTRAGVTFDANDLRPEHSMTVKEGLIIRTDPKAGTRVNRFQPVTVYVSQGPPIVNVPQITTDESVNEAKTALKKAGFKVTVLDPIFSDTVKKGNVVTVAPANLSTAAKGTTFTLTPSKGEELVTVPDIPRGTSSEDAIAILTQARLGYTIDNSATGGIFDKVYKISPGAGTQVPPGTVVTLTIV